MAVRYALVTGKTIDHHSAQAKADYHCITFTDNEIEFAPEYSEKNLRHVPAAASAGNYKGTGMGLVTCKKVPEAQHGFIAVESAVGTSATFSHFLQELKASVARSGNDDLAMAVFRQLLLLLPARESHIIVSFRSNGRQELF